VAVARLLGEVGVGVLFSRLTPQFLPDCAADTDGTRIPLGYPGEETVAALLVDTAQLQFALNSKRECLVGCDQAVKCDVPFCKIIGETIVRRATCAFGNCGDEYRIADCRVGDVEARGNLALTNAVRKLAIALWRFVEDGVIPEGATLKA
jgi:hypothetical protein